MVTIAICLLISCDEGKFLEEKALDFYSTENAMSSTSDYESSLNYLYNSVRGMVCNSNIDTRAAFNYATDFAFNATDYYVPQKLNDYENVMVPTFSVPSQVWQRCYLIISNANTILTQLENTTAVPDVDKKIIRGEALFFRAFAYRMLGHLFGGVPLVLDQITSPKRDFQRATREQTYLQVKNDLEEAITLLPDIENVKDGKVNKQVACHLLSEIDISLKDYDGAIDAATQVINHPGMGLMTDRFGSRATEDGDVYWDLFRLNNQNRSSGNTESLLVLQFDYNNKGSELVYTEPYTIIPPYQSIQITAKDADGNEVKTKAFAGVTDKKCGRGIGWMQPTSFFFNDLWKDGGENDIRNSQYNIIRDLQIDNPASPAFGKWLVKDGYSKQVDSIRYWYPLITKNSRIGNYPEDFYSTDANGNPIMTKFGEHVMLNSTTGAFKDVYLFREAETYLLRAEAYLGKGDKENAAKDINIVRNRAHATPVQAEKVDIDYILDARMRELYDEELRAVTLCRLGKFVDRNRKYNPKTGTSIQDYHNLWPIPYSEIERNVGAKLEQNPGYSN